MVKGSEKTQYIEELGKSTPVVSKKDTPIIDLDGDGNFGNLGAEIAKMETEIQKMKQGLSDEGALSILGEIGSILAKIKAGVSSGELKMLIEQAMNKKKEANVELNRNIGGTDKEKEKKDEIDALLKRLKEMIEEKEKNIDTPVIYKPDIEIESQIQKATPFIGKIITALKSVFETKSDKPMPAIDNKDKDKDKNIPIEASIIEQKKKSQITKEENKGQEIQQNEQLIGLIKNLAKAGEVQLLTEVLNDNKDNLQVEDYAKALGKKVTPDMNIDKLKVELKSNARNNRIKKVEAARSIEIHKTAAPLEEKKKEISPRLLRAHENKDITNEKVQGMERTLDLNNNNNKY